VRYCEVCRASFQALRSCPRDGVATRADLSDPLLGHVLGERYRVLERIAAGGMGQVYRAVHSRITSLFAVKVLYGDIAHDPQMRSRFEREAEAMSALQSRHIVRVVDFGESPEGLLYLVMEYLDGTSVSAAIARGGAIGAPRAADIARQIARGLAHAHERGVVHRDLKSANVMLITEDDEPDVARILDFGIARIQQAAPLTEAGMVLGTPEYMAPEQFRDASSADARTDLYALGVILYEMLSGRTPFEATSLAAIATAHVHDQPPPISRRNPSVEVARDLEAVVMRLLAKSPEDRYASARALVEALRPRSASRSSLAPASRDASVVEAISLAIQTGAPAYNAGDHQRCYQVYRDTAAELLESGTPSVAAAARLEVGLARAAAQSSATLAAWEMRYAFDDLLHVGGAAVTKSGGPGGLTEELAAAASLVAPRYSAGHLELVGDYYLALARRLAEHLRRLGVQPSLCVNLERAAREAEEAGGGQRALAVVGSVLESLRQGTHPTAAANLSAPSLEPFSAAQRLSDRIVQAIGVGAPAYNQGDVEGCLRIYRQTAESLVGELARDPAGAAAAAVLTRALAEAARGSADQGAWKLRHAFDSLLAALPK
jgi:tRNA A-37 threonylcarbamoyl transferase component Bud32